MLRTIRVQAHLPYTREVVWRALTDSKQLEQWFMPSDFEPIVGREFVFRVEGRGGLTLSKTYCRVLEVDPPNKLRFSWRAGSRKRSILWLFSPQTTVDFRLTSSPTGTVLEFVQGRFGVVTFMSTVFFCLHWRIVLRKKLPSFLKNQQET